MTFCTMKVAVAVGFRDSLGIESLYPVIYSLRVSNKFPKLARAGIESSNILLFT